MARLAISAVAGALLTALGFGIGVGPWGWVVLAALVATLLGGLAVKYGLHRFVAAYLLNVWFIIALGLPTLLAFDYPSLYHSSLIHPEPWKQALAWLIGSALWIVYTLIAWLVQGRITEPQPVAEIPGDISPRPLTRPLILFAVIRALAVTIAVAIAFGLVLLAVDNRTALEVIIVVLFALAGAIRTVSYTWYTAAVAGAVLIAAYIPHPANLTDEGRRILFTLAGVGISMIVLLLAGLLQKHLAKAAPKAASTAHVHGAQAG